MDNEEGLTIALSPVQLAAILSETSISNGETLTNRLVGGLKLLGGSLEMVGAGALLLTPEPTMATKAGGVVLGVHGSDTASTGLWQVWTGQEQRTLTDKSAAMLAQRLGADPTTSSRIGTAVDVAVPILVSVGVGAARVMAVKRGRISLVEHEAQAGSRLGGHTIARHVGRTEAQLRARLAAQANIDVASTFKTLEQAERAIFQALRANRANIEAWASGANPGATQKFLFTAKDFIGEGVVRATGTLEQMKTVRVVLKMQAYRGKLYYILTAFPQL